MRCAHFNVDAGVCVARMHPFTCGIFRHVDKNALSISLFLFCIEDPCRETRVLFFFMVVR